MDLQQSQLGLHDSELAIVIEDTDLIDSKMNGERCKVGRHAATLRRLLWREHLGLLEAQEPNAGNAANAQPPNDVMNENFEGPEYDFVEDPLSEDLWNVWTDRATKNTEIYRYLFRADPDDNIKTFDDYDKFSPQGQVKQGHIQDEYIPVDEVKKKLDEIKGHLVWMPLDFLKDAEMAEPGLSVNQLTEVWCHYRPACLLACKANTDDFCFFSEYLHLILYIFWGSVTSMVFGCFLHVNRHGHIYMQTHFTVKSH